MSEYMLRPGWPGTFHRTIDTGKKSRLVEFAANKPVVLSEAEAKALGTELGTVVFEVMRDEKGRPRFVESIPPSDLQREEMEREVVANI